MTDRLTEKYDVEAICPNCGTRNKIYIPMGVPIDGQTSACKHCGCDIVAKAHYRAWEQIK